MTSERFQRIEHLVLSAIELAPAERERLLAAECNGDDELRREVESLLSFQNEAENFISKSAIAAVASNLAESDLYESVKGQTLGSYRLVKELGHGGMGAVYLAERADEYQKQVAIKVVKRGLATHDLVTRLRSERQILANLDHPNIAKLLDGGTLEDGSPYFVMDYVEGLPIDSYCDQQELSMEARLQLFRKVCAAVAYAHRNLVIHRDLKPSNIIVAHDGTPKLLDFGIAKVLDPSLQTTGDHTATIARIMTPQYASPEQIRGSTVTTSSDIYSLGVLLYRLLSGHLPYQLKSLLPIEIERVVCEKEPERPSTAAARSREDTGGASSQSVIRNPRVLRGDLDNIVLMAMRKEPERRYSSAEQFAEDVRRYLDGLPVAAARDTFGYRSGKFIRRHKMGVAATALVAIALVAGIIITSRQSRVAQREKARAESINAFLEQTLRYSNPITSTMRKSGGETTVNQILDEAARRLDSGEFDASPELKAALELTVSQTYFGQGKYQQARKHLEQYVVLVRRLYDEDDPKRIAGEILWAGVEFDNGQFDQAEKNYRRNLPLLKREYKKGYIKPEVLAVALNSFAYLRRTQGDSKEAEQLFRESLEVIRTLSGEALSAVATTRSTLASTIADQGRFDDALKTAREAVAEYQTRGETDSPNYGFSLTVLGGFLTENGDYTQAEDRLLSAETIFRKLLAPRSLWLGDNLRNQAVLLYNQEKYSAAIEKADMTLKIYEESFGKHYDNYPTALIVRGLALTKLGRGTEGERALREAVDLRTSSLPAEHFWVALANSALGECLTIEKRYAEAAPLLLASYERLKSSQGEQNPRTLLAQRRLNELYSVWRHADSQKQ